MKYIQFNLTVTEGKWLIGEAISRMESVRHAFENGRLVFKGGTTTSCASQLITGIPLRISGRNTPRGAVAAKTLENSPHTLLWKNGSPYSLDDRVDNELLELEPDDIMITGANLIDVEGNAAMLAGSPGGSLCGKATSAMATEGFKVIIAAGLEKLIPGKVADAVLKARRKGVDSAYGMACGLFPIVGQVITELEAIKLLADVEVVVIGRGGIHGAEGGVLFQVWGKQQNVVIIEEAVERCKGKPVAGDPATLVECKVPSYGCKVHLSCRYRKMMEKN